MLNKKIKISMLKREKLEKNIEEGGKVMKALRSNKGFTLIEIIAVLIILGILAAVAVPKYVDMAGEAKKAAAQGQVAELKSMLNLGYAKLYLKNGTAPTAAADVITEAGIGTTAGTAPDIWTFSVTGANNKASITISNRNGDTGYTATGAWYIPTSS